MVEELLFRCFETRDKFWLFEDLSIYSAEFPDYLSMMLMNGSEHYKLSFWIGGYDKHGKRIYFEDIIKYKGSLYRVTYECPGVLFEHIMGDLEEDIDPDLVEKVGSTLEGENLAPFLNLV